MSQRYIYNRNKLMQSLPPQCAALLIAGNESMGRTGDTTYPFRQDSNMLYLCGIQQPRIALIGDVAQNQWWLVIPQTTLVEKIFDDANDWGETAQRAGLNGCIEWAQAIALLRRKSKKGDIYYNMAAKKRMHGVFNNPLRSYISEKLRRQNIALHDARPYIARLRMIKQPYEIRALTQAVRITQSTLHPYVESPQKLILQTEQRIANTITAEFYNNDVMHAYEPIVAANTNAAILHHLPDETVIKSGSTILFDVGAEYDGYAADISRTIQIDAPQETVQLIEDVMAVQQTLIQSIKPGGYWKALHEQAINELENVAQNHRLLKHQAIKDLFPHAIGHFLGLDVHDVGDYTQPFQEGMVLTVEPGLYSKKYGTGVRIEDDIVVTKTGAKILK